MFNEFFKFNSWILSSLLQTMLLDRKFKLINCPLYTTGSSIQIVQVSVKRPEVRFSTRCALMTDPFEEMI